MIAKNPLRSYWADFLFKVVALYNLQPHMTFIIRGL